MNLVTPPVSVSELYSYLTGEAFENITGKTPYNYNIKSKYSPSGYIITKDKELLQIKRFVESKAD